MVKFVNKLTGTIMLVDDSRKDEYIKLGHKEAPVDAPKEEKKPVRRRKKEK